MANTFELGQRVRHISEEGPDMAVVDFAIDGSNPNNLLNNIGDPNRPICRYFHESTQDWKTQEFLASELIPVDAE